MALAPIEAPPKHIVDVVVHRVERAAASRPRPSQQQPSQQQNRPSRRRRLRWSLELVVACAATVVSILAYVYWSWQGLILAYTDPSPTWRSRGTFGFDHTRIGAVGSAWLPLDHLLMLPLIWIDPLYRSGLAGVHPSMAAYVIGCARHG